MTTKNIISLFTYHHIKKEMLDMLSSLLKKRCVKVKRNLRVCMECDHFVWSDQHNAQGSELLFRCRSMDEVFVAPASYLELGLCAPRAGCTLWEKQNGYKWSLYRKRSLCKGCVVPGVVLSCPEEDRNLSPRCFYQCAIPAGCRRRLEYEVSKK